jgi:predicted metal-binding membrane protein
MTAQATSEPVQARAPRPFGLQLIAAIIFLGTTAYTVYSTRSMSGGMKMPGGWTMSMMWMPMPGQTLVEYGGMFIAMWTAMMVAMMLPSAMPMILIYRRAATFNGMPAANLRTALMAGGYFLVWAAFGAVVWIVGLFTARWEMASDNVSRAMPAVAGITLILCGIYQWTRWKHSCLKHCRDPLGMMCGHFHGGRWSALGLGLHHGAFCGIYCSSLMLIQIVLGMMNLVVMAVIALVIAMEKMLPRGIAVARVAGVITIAAGVALLLGWNIL